MKTWVQPSRPEEIQPFPWLSAEAKSYFESLLRPDMLVVEFGAGGSTLWLSERVKHVYSYENDPDWLAVLRKRKPENVTLFFESLPTGGERADLLFIDGEPVELRGEWLDLATTIVKDGGIVVLDNANRPEYAEHLARFTKHAKLLKRTARATGTMYAVTDFYQCE